MTDTHVMILNDGRELAWVDIGPRRAPVVMVFHGTPGSRIQVSYDEGAIVASGVRLIALDRPGYGHSTFHKHRQLTDWPGDVAQLAHHLKLQHFSVAGVSGGGPHAVVCARFLPE